MELPCNFLWYNHETSTVLSSHCTIAYTSEYDMAIWSLFERRKSSLYRQFLFTIFAKKYNLKFKLLF